MVLCCKNPGRWYRVRNNFLRSLCFVFCARFEINSRAGVIWGTGALLTHCARLVWNFIYYLNFLKFPLWISQIVRGLITLLACKTCLPSVTFMMILQDLWFLEFQENILDWFLGGKRTTFISVFHQIKMSNVANRNHKLKNNFIQGFKLTEYFNNVIYKVMFHPSPLLALLASGSLFSSFQGNFIAHCFV